MKKYVKSSITRTESKQAARNIVRHFLDNAGYWQETSSLTDGYDEDEIVEIDEDVTKLITSIMKAYNL